MKPDWEKFGRCILERFCKGDMEIDMSDVQDWGVEAGVLQRVPGGFDPDKHIDVSGILEPGDDMLAVTTSEGPQE